MKDKKENNADLTTISKYISFILRHKPEAAGIQCDDHGWTNVDELLAGINKKYFIDRSMLEEIVRDDNKQRYAFNEDGTKIRANQGHSFQVDLELPEAEPPEILYHGTAERFAASIEKQGLLRGERQYVHLSADAETAVKVGRRHGKPVVYTVNAAQMNRDGYAFYLSANGVWLTEAVPAEYLKKMGEQMTDG
ncbi:MAG: RNA 2'-phosphotransferase [Clostridia bacterium]|nr:RNA 2'-phosphotransferase [Clostridia bacterium]